MKTLTLKNCRDFVSSGNFGKRVKNYLPDI